jgi:hypothetical protein
MEVFILLQKNDTLLLTTDTYYRIRCQFGVSADADNYPFSFTGITCTYNMTGYVFNL